MKTKDLKILYLSTFIPRKCGIAYFTQNTINSIYSINQHIDQKVIAVDEMKAPKRNYPALVKYWLDQEELKSYEKTADYINESGADILFLQHEYNIFGGFDGVFILKLLKKIKIPAVTFFHTIPILKDSKKREYRLGLLKKICKFSKYAITTVDIGKKILTRDCMAPSKKIVVVYHGGPNIPLSSKKERDKIKKKLKLKEKFIILSHGFLSKKKGHHIGIKAVSKLIKKYPNIVYIILGKARPIKRKYFGEDFAFYLRKQIKDLKIEKNVLLINKYSTEEEIIEYLKISDIFLMPYLVKEKVSSGVLAYAMVAGSCVVSTPFIHAKELIGKDRGYFIDFESSDSIAETVSDLIENPKKIEETRKKTYEFGRSFTWEKTAEKLVKILQKASVEKK